MDNNCSNKKNSNSKNINNNNPQGETETPIGRVPRWWIGKALHKSRGNEILFADQEVTISTPPHYARRGWI